MQLVSEIQIYDAIDKRKYKLWNEIQWKPNTLGNTKESVKRKWNSNTFGNTEENTNRTSTTDKSGNTKENS